MIPVCEPVLDGREEAYVLECLRTNWISSSGTYIPAFEKAFSRSCGVREGVACSSGTTAIHLALAALGVGAGDEVIVPDFTLIVAANMVALTGARAVLVDADPATWGIDPARIEEKITPRTKAIMVVHMYGHPCDMDPILAIARRHGLKVIEDGAEAHGADYKGRRVGALGDAACFSFYGNKILTTGEGGMVVTDDAALAERVRLLRNQAFEEPRFVHRFLGFNYRLTNLQAAIGLAQCEQLDEKIARKRRLAQWYTARLKDEPDLTLPPEAPWAKSVYWMYGIVLQPGFGCSRDALMQALRRHGVDTRAFFHPLHRQPVFMDSRDPRFPDTSGAYPVAERLGRDGLYLPSGLGLTQEQVQRVVAALRQCRKAGALAPGIR
ncbi:MAG: DegT/DnrJ/EryC1/StrS family aminotransferase [Candidatus Omnitrophica bacterium]|nr:DegT/DnrJ/EryC1/StrS family aminotransferase [Candidatus Omnitrophota bacterium]